MAIKSVSAQRINDQLHGLLVSWLSLANGDTGEPYLNVDFADRTVQVDGTFGVGGSITLQGSNDPVSPTNWFALTDPQGNAITKTAAGLEVVEEGPLWVRPAVTAGDGSTLLNCRMWIRRNRGVV